VSPILLYRRCGYVFIAVALRACTARFAPRATGSIPINHECRVGVLNGNSSTYRSKHRRVWARRRGPQVERSEAADRTPSPRLHPSGGVVRARSAPPQLIGPEVIWRRIGDGSSSATERCIGRERQADKRVKSSIRCPSFSRPLGGARLAATCRLRASGRGRQERPLRRMHSPGSATHPKDGRKSVIRCRQ
jgi:hypothetical protein